MVHSSVRVQKAIFGFDLYAIGRVLASFDILRTSNDEIISMTQESVPRSRVLSSDTWVKRSNDFIDAEIDNEVVALSIAKGTCYGLNRVGSRIWNLLASPNCIGDICATLLSEYEIDPTTCEQQVLDLLEELQAEGMVIA